MLMSDDLNRYSRNTFVYNSLVLRQLDATYSTLESIYTDLNVFY